MWYYRVDTRLATHEFIHNTAVACVCRRDAQGPRTARPRTPHRRRGARLRGEGRAVRQSAGERGAIPIYLLDVCGVAAGTACAEPRQAGARNFAHIARAAV